MKTTVVIFFLWCVSLAAETIDLSGRWSFELDPRDEGIVSNFFNKTLEDSLTLPGTTAQARKGNLLRMPSVLPNMPPENLNPKKGLTFGRDQIALMDSPLAHLYQNFSYIGPAWYRREIKIPNSWANRDVQLVLERVIWETRVWINGQFIGARNSLTTPHRYEIGPALRPGRNVIVIRVDNRRQLAIGDPHAYTEQTQTIWNGIVGRIALEARDKTRIDRVQLRPIPSRGGVEVTVQTHNGSGHEVRARLTLRAAPFNFTGHGLPVLESMISLPVGDNEWKFFYPMATNFEYWSEFDPKLYRLRAALRGEDFQSENDGIFGIREFRPVNHEFTINGRPVFLRGTVNNCEFPRTGYPDMSGDLWRKIFSTAKACGLNHIRFHTWCPPEIAFELADQCGIYLEVELPDWSFKIGQDAAVTDFFRQEGERMIREYGNHPSWVMFTLGNELKGDYSVLDDLERHFRKIDPQLLFDSTTYPSSASRGKTPGPADDYYISQATECGRARGQGILNDTAPNTEANFAEAAACLNVPLVSHEVGQYCVYPRLAEISKYSGVLHAPGFEAIRADLKRKGRLAQAPLYTRDSGKLAALLYKEEIERALRTTNQAGFQLLGLNDFPGQGTSTVGLFDAFWDSKGLIKTGEFRKFCGPIVPLVLMPRRVFQNDEVFDAGVEIANFGPLPLTNATIDWKILDGKSEIGHGSFLAPLVEAGHGRELNRIRLRLSAMVKAAKLNVIVTIRGTSIRNDWEIWVYPALEDIGKTKEVEVFRTADARFYQALSDGKRVLLLPTRADVVSPLAAQFVPTFWNPVMFPNQPGTMGGIIDPRHPVFADFPTDPWTNWQWWELLNHSFALNLETLSARVAMPLRFVDKFNRNALPASIFEARVGKGRLLVCTLDISSGLETRIAARQLRRSTERYMAGDQFQPRGELSIAELKKLFWVEPPTGLPP